MQVRSPDPRIRRLLPRLLAPALAAVDPAAALRRHVRRRGSLLQVGARRYDLDRYERIVAVGAGKASARMGAALEAVLGARLEGGLLVVKYGHGAATTRLAILEAGHPVPDRAGEAAAARLLALVRSLGPRDLLVVLLSGGASSLLPAPAPGLSLADKQRTSALLLGCGAGIREINAVRKHLSAIKGGRLAAACRATIVTLTLSDVLGDDLAAIGSGPTAPDPTTFAEACAILRRYGLWRRVPASVRRHLSDGLAGRVAETPKPGARLFARVHHQIIGNNRQAVAAAATAARRAGLRPLVLTTTLTGEAREAARLFGALAREVLATGRPVRPPCCVLAGGELTVTLRGHGRGGRAQEFALAAAREIAGLPRLWIAGVGTDGTDGPTDAAGAVADGRTAARASRAGLDPEAALARNDAYTFFTKAGGLLVTGPTGTNVNDLYLLIVK